MFMKTDYPSVLLIYTGGTIGMIRSEGRTDTVEYSQAYTDYKILVYVDTVGCTSCQLQLERWLDWVDCLKNKSSYSVSYLFDFYPKNTEELVDLLRFYDFSVPVCIDETDRLNQLNKFPAGGKFHTFLLDRDNKVPLYFHY